MPLAIHTIYNNLSRSPLLQQRDTSSYPALSLLEVIALSNLQDAGVTLEQESKHPNSVQLR